MKYTRQQIFIRIYINYLEYRINTPNGKNYYDNEGIDLRKQKRTLFGRKRLCFC